MSSNGAEARDKVARDWHLKNPPSKDWMVGETYLVDLETTDGKFWAQADLTILGKWYEDGKPIYEFHIDDLTDGSPGLLEGWSRNRIPWVTDKDAKKKMTWRLSAFFRWYDLWVGAYIDVKNSALYICPIPTICLKIWREEVLLCPVCGKPVAKIAHDTGEGWHLSGECQNPKCNGVTINEIAWPFGHRKLGPKELEGHGYFIQ